MNMPTQKPYNICNLFVIMLTIMCLTGCANTLEGIGRDIEHAGEKIQETF